MTNAHVAVPWRFEASALALAERGFQPVMRRVSVDPMGVELIMTDDIAVLRCRDVGELVSPLQLAQSPAEPGEEIFALEYPTGIRALLARRSPSFVESLMQDPRPDFRETARRLSAAGYITPLATRGIVAQLTPDHVAYDDETTHGGSGGPVLRHDGEVLAINAEVVVDFGGSNLGSPSDRARRLLDRALGRRTP